MASSKVIVTQMGAVRSVKARDVISANVSDMGATKTPGMSFAKTAHVASAEAAHMTSAASAKAAASVSAAAATSTPRLCRSSNKAAGKQRGRQNHHHSSSHEILLRDGRNFPPQAFVRRWWPRKAERHRPDGLKMGCILCIPTKFAFRGIWMGGTETGRVYAPDQ
ncbi:hypothetical protein [Bradyrhizobium tropiciagri]|uniref:hypothetical protein n=1 Tax=Bradyrhizobium tropiciagri TaxID=312253 RepID=UPI00138F7F45|nr:hypothetical protein [Bradyrhizobium tropiciagri]